MVRNASQGVIGISERNPHYFQYRGKEILLITSAELYGAVINKKFDYKIYLDTLAAYGFNYTRIYPGAFVEKNDMFGGNVTLAPEDALIVPWARSDEPGYIGGGNKFDLNKWDPAYFARLRDFLSEAERRGIIVEMCFFNAQYPHCVEYSPLYKSSNIQGIGSDDDKVFQYRDDPGIFGAQLSYVEKLITETNDFDNLIYEFIDEPTLFRSNAHKAYNWISALIDRAVEAEDKLPKKHMLAQQLEIGVDYADDDRIALIVTQYVGVASRQIGGVVALNSMYRYGKPIEINESGYVPVWFQEHIEEVSRIEAWEFMIGGGAAYNQLNGYFLPSNPSGDHEMNHKIMRGLKRLRTFLEGFEFAKMTRDNHIVSKVSIGASVNVIAEKGKQYAMYMHHSFPNFGKLYQYYYDPNFGEFEPTLTIKIEKGGYTVTFVDPATLDEIGRAKISSDGGDLKLVCPRYHLDLAVKIISDDKEEK